MIIAKIKNRILRIQSARKLYYAVMDHAKFLKICFFKKQIFQQIQSSKDTSRQFAILTTLIPSHQRKNEFCSFIDFLNTHKISVIVEIGTADSGTHLLLSELVYSQKKMVAIDIEIRNRKSLSAINSNNDTRFSITGSSHSEETHAQLSNILKEKKIDLLFIDGDHSYEGVREDFELYKSSVSKTGIVAFHDIVPDSFSRTGLKTSSYVGEVPKFWNEIKQNYTHKEFIDSDDQDGCGIGIIYFD
jgi:predicted O-methyltransferase YrrM